MVNLKEKTNGIFIDMHDETAIPEFDETHRKIIKEGTEYSKQTNVAIVSIARNSAKNIGKNLTLLSDVIEPMFNNVYYYLYENDSTDNTAEIISHWAKGKDNVVFETEKLDTPYLPLSTSTTRTENLAKARNKCLDYVKTISDKVDYVIVIDTDFVLFSVKGLMNTMGWLQNQSHVSAIAGYSFLEKKITLPNGTKTNGEILTNYDSWAYRQSWWTDTQQVGLMYWFQWWIPLVGSPLTHVNSAFGGCCVYRKEYFIKGRYSGENCEHVMFHNYLKNTEPSFQLYANPSQIMYVEV